VKNGVNSVQYSKPICTITDWISLCRMWRAPIIKYICNRLFIITHTHIYHGGTTWFIHCLTTGSQPLQKQILHTHSSFNFHYPLSSLMSFISCLCFLPCLPITSILPSIFPSVMCFRRQVLHKMWPRQLPLILLFVGYSLPSWFIVGIPVEGSQVIPNFKFYLTPS